MGRTITVKGTGTIKIKPDMAVVSVTVRNESKKYEEAVNGAVEKLQSLKSALAGAGVEGSSVKTVNYNVNAEYGSRKKKDGEYERYFKGYSCTHSLKIEFDFDKKTLGAVLGAVVGSVADPDLQISFTVKDKEAASDMLLAEAVKNSAKRARILADAANVTLGDIISVDYSWGDMELCSNTQFDGGLRCMGAAPMAASFDVTPDDITVNDNVTVTWEIK